MMEAGDIPETEADNWAEENQLSRVKKVAQTLTPIISFCKVYAQNSLVAFVLT